MACYPRSLDLFAGSRNLVRSLDSVDKPWNVGGMSFFMRRPWNSAYLPLTGQPNHGSLVPFYTRGLLYEFGFCR